MTTRAIGFKAWAVLANPIVGGPPLRLPVSSGHVVGRIGVPSRAAISIPYESTDIAGPQGVTSAIQGMSPIAIYCSLKPIENRRATEYLLFDGVVSHVGREKHEKTRNLTITAEGYSGLWFRTALFVVNKLFMGSPYSSYIKGMSVGDATLGYDPKTDVANLFSTGNIAGFISSVLGYSTLNSKIGPTALSKVVVAPSAVSSLLQTGSTGVEIFMQMVSDHSSRMKSTMSFLKDILSIIYYEMIDGVGSCAHGRILFKPQTLFTDAPSTNIFLPKNYSQFQENRALLDTPTRMMLQTNAFLCPSPAGRNDTALIARYAPEELQRAIDLYNWEQDQGFNFEYRAPVTEEESLRGIVPEYGALSNAEWVLTHNTFGSFEEVASTAAATELIRYKFRVKQLEYRQAVVHHCLAPDIQIGFPGQIVDDRFPLKGLVSEVSHSFTCAPETVSTVVRLTHTRSPEEQLEATTPPWLQMPQGW